MTKEPKLSKQELEIAQAACCVGTMWDEYEGTEDFDHMVRLRLNHLIELVRIAKTSLLSNLDEAAFNYAELCKYKGVDKLLCAEHFKSGVAWLAGQGVKAHCVESSNPVSDSKDENLHLITLVYAENENTPYVLAGDEVEIILRKKQ